MSEQIRGDVITPYCTFQWTDAENGNNQSSVDTYSLAPKALPAYVNGEIVFWPTNFTNVERIEYNICGFSDAGQETSKIVDSGVIELGTTRRIPFGPAQKLFPSLFYTLEMTLYTTSAGVDIGDATVKAYIIFES